MTQPFHIVKPRSDEEKQTRSTVDTIEITEKVIASWKIPTFQRELKLNAKVLEAAKRIERDGGVLPGILTIGVFDGRTYLVDGQHRVAAFENSGCAVGYADVRTVFFGSMAEMAEEFVTLNSSLVRLRTDDIMRGMEPSTPALQRVRRECGFVGYEMIRRNEKSPVLSMSVFLRSWIGSRTEAPAMGVSSMVSVQAMNEEETNNAIEFGTICYEAWKRDRGYARLWSSLNFTLCAWLYRRLVLGQHFSGSKRWTRMAKEEFKRGLLALSADQDYLDYLVGRNLGDRDRAPAYNRLKSIMARRYLASTGTQAKMPSPEWAKG